MSTKAPSQQPAAETPAELSPSVTNSEKDASETTKKPVVNEYESKKQTFIVRTIWTLVMIFGMFFIIGAGHFWTICFVTVLQVLVFKECISITSQRAKMENNLQYTVYLNWYFLITSIIYLDGKTLITYFSENLVYGKSLPFGNDTIEIARFFVQHHQFISYLLYVMGFVFFVCTLKKSSLMFQFAQLCSTHMILFLIILQGHCIVNNILHGMIWFLLPVGLVITNDIFAYICGITFGRTQLIAISPKKTVEGFLGAWVCTTFMGVFLTNTLINYNYLICPVTDDLSINCLSGITCDINPIFIAHAYKVPAYLADFLGMDIISVKPVYFHSIVLATFASLIAPFGGFFASGLKRAFKVKDFGDTIPGHGGITDRMDCQFMMGSFSYLYYETFISTHNLHIGDLLQTIIINLSLPDIIVLVKSLHNYLFQMGFIDQDTYEQLSQLLS